MENLITSSILYLMRLPGLMLTNQDSDLVPALALSQRRPIPTMIDFMAALEPNFSEAYFNEVQIQHTPRYAYGEEIAALVEQPDRFSLARSFELSQRQDSDLMAALELSQRQPIVILNLMPTTPVILLQYPNDFDKFKPVLSLGKFKPPYLSQYLNCDPKSNKFNCAPDESCTYRDFDRCVELSGFLSLNNIHPFLILQKLYIDLKNFYARVGAMPSNYLILANFANLPSIKGGNSYAI